jgi:hypothetical protein
MSVFIRAIQGEQQRLAEVVRQWAVTVRADASPVTDPDARCSLTLPLDDLARRPIDPGSALAAYDRTLLAISDAEARERIHGRLSALALTCFGIHAPTTRVLAELARESASRRALLGTSDLFDVSAASALAATALANLLHRRAALRRSRAKGQPESSLDSVLGPLDAVRTSALRLRPGDLWFLGLAAWTVRSALLQAERDKRQGDAQLLLAVTPRFVSLSLLTKLLEADRLGVEIAKRSDYRLWPGLALLLEDSGAGALRAVVMGELSRRVCADRVGISQVAFLRLLEALSAIDQEPLAYRARHMIATLLWEILELDPDLLRRMLERGKAAGALFRAIELIERHREDPEPEEVGQQGVKLSEVCSILREFSQYEGLRAMRMTSDLVASSMT